MIDFNQFFDSNISEGINGVISDLQNLRKELNALASDTKKQISLINPNDQKAIDEAIKDVEDLTKAKADLDRQEKTALRTKKRLQELTDEELILVQQQKIRTRERNQLLKQEAIIRKSQVGSIERLRAELSKTTLQWKRLSEEERENGKDGRRLIKTKLDLTSQLKKLEKQTGDTRRNVGNYTDSLSKLGKVAARAFVGRSIVDGLRRIGGAISSLIESNKDASESIGELDSGISKFIRAFTNAATEVLEFLAPALTAIVNIGTSIIDTFFGAGISIDNFSATSNELNGVIKSINKEFAKEIGNVDQLFTSLNDANSSSEERIELIDKINKQYGQYLPSLLTEESSLIDIAKAQELVNEQLSLGFLLKVQEATQTDIFTNKAKGLSEAFDEIRKASSKVGQPLLSNFNDFRKAGEILSKNAIAAQSFTRFLKDTETATDEGILRGLGIDKVALDLSVLAKNGKPVELLFRNLVKANNQYNLAAQDVSDNIQAISEDIKIYDRSLEGNTNVVKGNTSAIADNSNAISKNSNDRIKAIDEVQAKISKAEIDNLEDGLKKSLRLEDLRAKELKKQRDINFNEFKASIKKQDDLILEQYGKSSQELKDFRASSALEIIEFESLTQKLEEEQLKESNDRKLKLVKDYESKIKESISNIQKAADSESVAFEKAIKEDLKSATDEINAFQTEQAKKEADRIANREKRTEQLLSDIQKTSEKIGAEIVKVFDKQAELAGKLVSDQAENVETQRDRAEQGLENTLAFEQEQLRKRESEQLRAEKRAEQAAKLLTLLNLVSAYAASGDTNALSRGLVDFALLEALSAGFKDGGYTGDSRTDSVAGHVHGQEYVVTSDDTKRFGLVGKSGEDFSSTMEHYFSSQPVQIDTIFARQNADFNSKLPVSVSTNLDTSNLEREVVKMRKSFEKVEQNQYDLEKITEQVLEITKYSVRGQVKKIDRIKKRLDT